MNLCRVAVCCGCLLVSFVAADVRGEERNTEYVKIDGKLVDKKTAVFVFDFENHRFGEPENKAPLKYKSRIYTRWHPGEQRWLPDLVNPLGYFTSPDRFILPGSVVPGEWLGMQPGTRFEFVKNKPNFAAWQPTTKPLWVVWSVDTEKRTAAGEVLRATIITCDVGIEEK